jgi:hypothetical protein
MDAKEHRKQTRQYLKAKEEHRAELQARDQAVHGEFSQVRYDPATGQLRVSLNPTRED